MPTRHVQKYPVPDLPVVHRVGTRMFNSQFAVGFPALTKGPLLVSGSSNTELIAILQLLTSSFTASGTVKQVFVIDTQSELNGLISHYQRTPSKQLNLQVFRLGANVHLNLCDVILPIPSSGKQKDVKAAAAWKAHLISQILLSSLNTSEYLTSRYAIPLESQIRKTAEDHHLFTLRDVKLDVGGGYSSNVQENTGGVDMMFADMMTIEALSGILEQFGSFPEVNYSAFTGHFSNTLVSEGVVTFFQFGAQPPLIRRATIAFLLHYLSQTMAQGCVVLTRASEFFSPRTAYKRPREVVSSIGMDACNDIAKRNVMILSSHSLQALAVNLDTFDEIKNCVYLRMANVKDRDLVMSQHELEFERPKTEKYVKSKDFLGIMEGEGLLFREDASRNVGFHFKLENPFPINLTPISVLTTKRRGSETLGLTPAKYEILMKLLKLLLHHPCRVEEVMALVEKEKHGELSLEQFQTLGLFNTQLDGGVNYWIINSKGREYYNKQHQFINTLPAPLTVEEVGTVRQRLEQLESFYDHASSQYDRSKTNKGVKRLIGQLLNYTRCLRATSIPWMRMAEYHDLVLINSLEWQDFRNLFDLAHSMVNNLLLEINQLHQQQSDQEIHQSLDASAVRARSEHKNLNDFLPDDAFSILQQISEELEMAPYPKSGIVDIFYSLHTQQRSLLDELEAKKVKRKS
ncbi:MAG: hypothetical protein ACXAC8_10685 [Candidatus Hodarchaeales archaeon]